VMTTEDRLATLAEHLLGLGPSRAGP